jgi:hypothetical protein
MLIADAQIHAPRECRGQDLRAALLLGRGLPFRDVQRHIRSVYDTCGPRRMLWGTDWTRLPCTWGRAVTFFTEELPWLSAGDQAWIMGRGVCESLGWPTPGAT